MEMDGVELSFTDDALRRIVEKAMAKGLGARGLRSVLERVMVDLMYEIPDRSDIEAFAISSEFVDGETLELPRELRKRA